jgi:hypothetical protein
MSAAAHRVLPSLGRKFPNLPTIHPLRSGFAANLLVGPSARNISISENQLPLFDVRQPWRRAEELSALAVSIVLWIGRPASRG